MLLKKITSHTASILKNAVIVREPGSEEMHKVEMKLSEQDRPTVSKQVHETRSSQKQENAEEHGKQQNQDKSSTLKMSVTREVNKSKKNESLTSENDFIIERTSESCKSDSDSGIYRPESPFSSSSSVKSFHSLDNWDLENMSGDVNQPYCLICGRNL